MFFTGALRSPNLASAAAVTSLVLVLSAGGLYWFQTTPASRAVGFTIEELYRPVEYTGGFGPRVSSKGPGDMAREPVVVDGALVGETEPAASGSAVTSTETNVDQVCEESLRYNNCCRLENPGTFVSWSARKRLCVSWRWVPWNVSRWGPETVLERSRELVSYSIGMVGDAWELLCDHQLANRIPSPSIGITESMDSHTWSSVMQGIKSAPNVDECNMCFSCRTAQFSQAEWVIQNPLSLLSALFIYLTRISDNVPEYEPSLLRQLGILAPLWKMQLEATTSLEWSEA